MRNLINNSVLALFLIIMMTSCGKNYTFQKVVVNSTEKDIIVQYDCCGNEEQFIIPSHEERVVFICTYQSHQKPDCSSVEGDFSWTYVKQPDTNDSEKVALRDITNSDDWVFKGEGKNLSCVFTVELD